MAFDDDISEGSGGQSFDPKELLRTARDYWMLALILAAPCAIGFYFWKKQEVPVFRSNALILFEIQSERVVEIKEVVDPTLAGGGEAGMENYLAHLNSRVFLQEVVDSFSEEELERLVGPYEEEPEEGEEPEEVSPMVLLARNFGIAPTGQGTTVRLWYEHRDRQVAASTLSRLIEQYTLFLTRRAARANDAAIKFLSAEGEELRQQVRESDLALQKYREDNNVISLADTQNLVEQQLSRVSGATSEAYLARLQAEGTLERATVALEAGSPIAKIPAIMGYSEVRAVLAEINRIESEISVLGLRYGSRHPTMIEKQEILELTKQRLKGLVDEAMEYLQGQAQVAIANHERLKTEQATLEKESLKLDRLAIEFNVLQRRFESQKATYDRIVGRLNETEISSKLVQAPIRVVDGASTPGLPIRPDPQKIVLTSVGLFVAVFGGIIGAFAFLDRRIRSGAIIEDQLEVELLGEIPELKGIRERDKPHVVDRNLDLGLAEAFRSAAGKIILTGRQPSPKTVLVTSGSPGEGKSLFCSNLIWSLREQGKRVLLINADFRAPALDDILSEEGVPGSAEWYGRRAGGVSIEADLGNYRLSLADGVDFLPVGTESVRAQQILADGDFRSAVSSLSREYDYTVIDAPPGLVFHDAIGLADWVTETVVVVRYLNATVARVRRLLRSLEKTKSHKLGVILNGVPTMQSNEGYYRHARRYYERDGRRRSKSKDGKSSKRIAGGTEAMKNAVAS